MTDVRHALVTGANRGIGFETCRLLLARGTNVVLTARRAEDAEIAARQLDRDASSIIATELDVAREESVAKCASTLRSRGLKLDALVANAGISLRGFDGEVARKTMDVNFFGALRTCDAFTPLLAPDARVVLVSSGMGRRSWLSDALAKRFGATDLTRDALTELVHEFVRAVQAGTHVRDGWPSNGYAVSKIALNALAGVLAREHPAWRVNAVSPGWARTRMGGEGAPRSVEQGATSIVWGVTLPDDGPTGGFFEDGQPLAW